MVNTEILSQLNESQREAALYDDGSSLIIAGAGSGKTRVLTHKIAYHIKSDTIFKDLMNKVNCNNYDIIHASTLFSDGAIAYNIYKKFNIPYVVAVRSTDIVFFGKLLFHTWHNGRNILMNAQKIYFISNSLLNEFKKLHFVKNILNQIQHKFVVRYNGIDDFWLNNINLESENNHKLIFIGQLIPLKNIVRLVKAVSIIREQLGLNDVTLTVVGKGNDKKTNRIIKQNNDFVQYKGFINDKNQIMKILRQHAVFAMPSLRETFGLVFIEALSQGLALLYAKGNGIDGVFNKTDTNVGVAVNPKSVNDIADGLKILLENRSDYNNYNINFNLFKWKDIAEAYANDYNQIINK